MDQLELLNTWKTIKENLQKQYTDINQAFENIDKNNTQKIELEDLSNELKQSHKIQSDEIIHSLFDYLNVSKNGAISLEEFESKWTQLDQSIKKATNQFKFLQQKQDNKQDNQLLKSSSQKSAQQFSDLFKSYASGNSPTKYINIQGDFQINYFNQTPSKQLLKNDSKELQRKISPPKPSYLLRSKMQLQPERIKDMQKKINTLFNVKNEINEIKKSPPRIKRDFDSFLNNMRVGKPIVAAVTTRRQVSYPQLNLDFNNLFNQKKQQKPYEQRLSFRNNTSPNRSLDRLSLQQYAYQFYDMKYVHKQTTSFVPKQQVGKTTNWLRW